MTTETSELIFPNDYSQYSNIDEYKLKLQHLKNQNFTNATKEELNKALFDNLFLIPSLVGTYNQEKFNNFNFYRVRLNIDTNLEDLNLIKTYSYPLPQFCSKNGRANLKNKSVFYCSNSSLTSILESKPKVGDIGYLSLWKGNTNRQMKSGVLLPQSLTTENEWYVLAKDIYSYAEEEIKKQATSNWEYCYEGLKFIADLFINEKEPYPITSWISNELLYGSAWKDFIIYPSFVSKTNTTNIAFHPNVADSHLHFEKVIRFKILNINDDKFSLSTGRVGELHQNNIKWRTATEEELDFSLFPR